MLRKSINEKLRIHNRNISLATYPHNNSKIVVKGTLTDKNHKNFYYHGKLKSQAPMNRPVYIAAFKLKTRGSSCHLYAGRRPDNKQAPSGLILQASKYPQF